MDIKIIERTFDENARILVISDIHTNIDRFERLLKKMCYQPEEDYLVINGDMIEKGTNNIEALAYFRKLERRTPRMIILQGNCEAYVVEGGDILPYIRYRENSIINEWLANQGVDINDETLTEDKVYAIVRSQFSDDLKWLDQLPHALVTPEVVIVHAGVSKGSEPFGNKFDLLSQRGFMERGHELEQTVIVGHYPVVNYHINEHSDTSILFDKEKRIISLDGANQIEEDGQLNGLSIQWENNQIHYRSFAVDEYEEVEVLETFIAPEASIYNVRWPFGFESGKLLQEDEHFSLCEVKDIEQPVSFKNEYITKQENGTYVLDKYHASYLLSVTKGEQVSVIADTYSGYDYIKKDGVYGWVPKGILARKPQKKEEV